MKSIEYKGITYRSIRALAVHLGIEKSRIQRCLKRKISLDDPRLLQGFDSIKVGNVYFKSFNKACIHYGLCWDTVRDRINRGWSVEEAFEITVRNSQDKKGYVYKIKNNINNKIYVGITTFTLKERLLGHFRCARNNSNTKLHRAMRKYGFDNFTISLIKTVNSRSDLRKYEIYYIRKHNSITNGYNTSSGGGHLGDKFGTVVVFKGITYNSITALAKHLNLNHKALQKSIIRQKEYLRTLEKETFRENRA